MELLSRFFLVFVFIGVNSQIEVLQFGNKLINSGESDIIEDDPLNFNILDGIVHNVPSVDYFLEERPHDDIENQKHEIDTLGAAHADPTLHKWKHKLPIFHSHSHSHIHSIAHGKPHGIETAAVYPSVDHHFSHQSQSVHSHNKDFSSSNGHNIKGPVLVFPVNHQFSHHSQNDQFSSHTDQGFGSKFPLNRPDVNQWDKGFQQSQQSANNQNFNQLINNHNIQNDFGNFDSSGKIIYPSDTFNPGIVNINGHSNTVIQSGTSKKFISSHNGQIFSHEKAAPSSFDRDDHLIGISMPIEEQIYWQNKPQPSNIEETTPSAVYDREMNNILDILDERSYYLTRPEIDPSGKKKNADDSIHFDEIYHPDGQSDGGFNDNIYFNEEEQQEQNEYHPEISSDTDYTLESPNLVQVPYNNYFHSYYRKRNNRNKRSPRDINILSDNSMFFNISSWRLQEMNSKLNDTLLGYHNIVDDYRKRITDKRESIFVDLLDSIIGQFQMKEYENSNEIKKIQKRSATITKLLNNPDARLDVPKTLDNIGVITRNAFEDERSPMYHVRKFIGSTKNAVLSAMKIPPQNLVIPSNYEIKNIKPEEISDPEDNMVGGINPKILSRSGFGNTESMENYQESYSNDPYGIVETFARVGGAIRDSVRSGQNTINHISDIAHNARKIYHTTKNSVPRVLLPYAKAPVLMNRFKEPKPSPLKKAIVISPKVLAVKDPVVGSSRENQNFVSMGHILDAIGLTKPDKDQIDLEKIVLKMPGQGETRGIYIPPIGEVKSINGRILPNSKEGKERRREKTMKQLGRIQDKIVSTNQMVKDSIAKMRNDISKTLNETNNLTNESDDILQMKERNNIKDDNILLQSKIKNNISNVESDKSKKKHFTKQEENEIIDKFLYNIFENDENSKEKTKVGIAHNDIDENMDKGVKSKKNKNKTSSRMKSYVSSSDVFPNISESLLQETIKNITLDILEDERKNEISKMSKIKSNKIHQDRVDRKKKAESIKRPNMFLQSRFGDDDDMATTVPNNSTVSESKGLDENDEEAMKKVDQYVLNDVVSPMFSNATSNESVKNSFKLGDILELIEEPSGEESSNELNEEQSGEDGKESVPVFSSRNLLWVSDAEDNQEEAIINTPDEFKHPSISVGLNLPPELMTPFMSRAANANIDDVFNKVDSVEQNRGNSNYMSFNLPSDITVGSSKSKVVNQENDIGFAENTNKNEVVGLNLPPELMTPFMSRAANANIDDVFNEDDSAARNDMGFNLPSAIMVGSQNTGMKDSRKNGHESRNFDEDSKGEDIVGLGLPPELMTPSMPPGSNSNVEEVFNIANKDPKTREKSMGFEQLLGSIMRSSKLERIPFPSNEDRDFEVSSGNNRGKVLPSELGSIEKLRSIDDTFTSDEIQYLHDAVKDNNEMQNYLPILQMPLRTTKSVKKTLDEFIKKENETIHQILNTQENRLKNARMGEVSKCHEKMTQPFKNSNMMASSDLLKRMTNEISNGHKCDTRKCFQHPSTSQSHLHNDEQHSDENIRICICISENSDEEPKNTNQFSVNDQHYQNGEMYNYASENAKKGVGQGRTSMVVNENLKKPFMGLGNDDNIKKFYEEYNGHQEDGDGLFSSDEEGVLFSDE